MNESCNFSKDFDLVKIKDQSSMKKDNKIIMNLLEKFDDDKENIINLN